MDYCKLSEKIRFILFLKEKMSGACLCKMGRALLLDVVATASWADAEALLSCFYGAFSGFLVAAK